MKKIIEPLWAALYQDEPLRCNDWKSDYFRRCQYAHSLWDTKCSHRTQRCSKTTLIRAILNDIPHEGSIDFRDTENGHMRRMKIGYVPRL